MIRVRSFHLELLYDMRSGCSAAQCWYVGTSGEQRGGVSESVNVREVEVMLGCGMVG